MSANSKFVICVDLTLWFSLIWWLVLIVLSLCVCTGYLSLYIWLVCLIAFTGVYCLCYLAGLLLCWVDLLVLNLSLVV